ncbi:hypothetical protein Q7P37_006666 [Cladosporium fusiforme]
MLCRVIHWPWQAAQGEEEELKVAQSDKQTPVVAAVAPGKLHGARKRGALHGDEMYCGIQLLETACVSTVGSCERLTSHRRVFLPPPPPPPPPPVVPTLLLLLSYSQPTR